MSLLATHWARSIAMAVVVPSLGVSLESRAQDETPQYGIKQPEPRTGSSIVRYGLDGSDVPINKRYDQLSLDEKARINGRYERIEPGDEPPFPLKGLKPIYQAMYKAQTKLLVTGRLTVVAKVDASGEVNEVRVIGSPSDQMSKVAALVLYETKFKPAICRGTPCSMEFPFVYNFKTERY